MSDSRKSGSGPKQLELSLKDKAREKLAPKQRPTQGAAYQARPVAAPQPSSAPRPSEPGRAAGGGRPALRVISGEGQKRPEPLQSRDAVVRVLIEAGADLLLRRISSDRAEEIERSVDLVLDLFDKVDQTPHLMLKLRRELDALEQLVRETREVRGRKLPTPRMG